MNDVGRRRLRASGVPSTLATILAALALASCQSAAQEGFDPPSQDAAAGDGPSGVDGSATSDGPRPPHDSSVEVAVVDAAPDSAGVVTCDPGDDASRYAQEYQQAVMTNSVVPCDTGCPAGQCCYEHIACLDE
jgi:hypothetical protein